MLGHCKDRTLAAEGKRRIEWADQNMPVLGQIRADWEKTRPLKGLKIAACLHVTTETANLMRTLVTGGAEVRLCASNPLSTQDETAAALNEVYQIPTYAIRGEDSATYYEHIDEALAIGPNMTMDDGADLLNRVHDSKKDLIGDILGGTEETTTGVIRLKAMEKDGVLKYPVVAVNDALTKHLFDNRYGTGQSTIDGLMRATNHLIAGSVFVVIGYGWCGRGIAMRARGMGARVVVVEVDPMRALEAVMDGYEVTDMDGAAEIGDIFVTATGNYHVIDSDHFLKMKDGAIVANAGHFDVEINVEGLKQRATASREARPLVDEFTLPSGRRIYLLAEGRLVNLSSAEGHPAHVMDMSFANQALAAHWLYAEKPQLKPEVYSVPENIDREIARRKLTAMGITIGSLSGEQERYLSSYDIGT